MAHGIEDERKGAISGWSQAGNLGGAGVGGGLGLYLAQRVAAPWEAAAAVGLLCIACIAGLVWVDEPERGPRRPRYVEALADVARDVWAVMRSRIGLLAFVLMLLPIGSGGASGVWSAIAGEWRADRRYRGARDRRAQRRSQSGGRGAGGVSVRPDGSLDCLLRLRRGAGGGGGGDGAAASYCERCSASAPWRPPWCCRPLLRRLLAVVLEAIGKGAAATKFNLLSAASNVPIAAMTDIDGVFHDRYGTNAMLFGEAALALLAITGFAVLARATRPRRLAGTA